MLPVYPAAGGTRNGSANVNEVLGYTPPPPRFWKALVTVALPVALIAWTVPMFHVHMPMRVLVIFAVAAWLVIASIVHARVSNDWRANYSIEEYKANGR